MTRTRKKKDKPWYQQHSLSLVSVGLLILWIVGYAQLDPKTHLGAFCGNAIADWSGSVVIILGTKFCVEVGSAESHPVWSNWKNPFSTFLAALTSYSDWPNGYRLVVSILKDGSRRKMGPGGR